MSDFNTGERTMEIDQTAPVVAAEEMVIHAPVELVWQIMADIACWPRWNPEIQRVILHGPIRPATEFEWQAGGLFIRSRLEELSAPNRIGWTGRTRGIHAVHVWSFEQRAEGTYVRTEESFTGLIARLLAKSMHKTLVKALRQGLSALKQEAEKRACAKVS
jgi:hypothetical protein